MCNKKIIDKLNLKIKKSSTKLKTVVGGSDCNGRTIIKLKIGEIIKNVNVIIIDDTNFKYDLLLGLDVIKLFKLKQDENLKIKQKFNNKTIELNKSIEKDNIINFLVNMVDSKQIIDLKNRFNHLNEKESKEIIELLLANNEIFASDKYDVTATPMAKAEIKLIKNEIVAQRPYNCTIPDGQEIERQIENLLNRGLIEQSTSPYAAPVTLADKKECKKSRLCIDFSRLNKILVDESQPFLKVEDILDKLVDRKYFTKIDLNSAFWSVPLHKDDRFKTAFVTKQGHYQWTVLPFGLKTSPAIFQRILSAVLRKYNCSTFSVNYMDDILIFSKSFGDHLNHIQLVIKALRKEKFKANFSKCEFAQHKITYLGHLISENKIQPINNDLVVIKNARSPSNVDQLRRYLGKINYYHKYLPNAADLLEPFHKLLRKKVKFEWTPECESRFREVNNYLCSEPVLRIFNSAKRCYLFTDASGFGVSAVLKQIQEDNEFHPIGYFSMKLPEIKSRRDAIYLELLAIKKAIEYWHYYLYGSEFTIITDHQPLKNVKIKTKPDTKLGQMIMYLEQYNFVIVYREGKLNIEADELSRLPVLDYYEGEQFIKYANLLTVEKIKEIQKNMNQNQLKNRKLKKVDGIWFNIKKNKRRALVDKLTGKQLIIQIHNEFGHLGKSKLFNLINKNYYFDDMSKLVNNIVDACDVCIKNKSRRIKELGLTGCLGPPKDPYEFMSLDTIGGFGRAGSENKYVHVLIDHFTKYIWARCSTNQTSAEFIKLISPVANIVKIDTIMVDQYSGINSNKFKSYLKEKEIKLIFTGVNSPQSNGTIERAGQTIVNRIRCKLNESVGSEQPFAKLVAECINEYNLTIHESTGYAPKFLLLGTSRRINPFEEKLNLEKAREEAYAKIKKSILRNKSKLDKNKREYEFKLGDKVYVELTNKLNRSKLDKIRNGPFKIVKIISPHLYKLNTNKRKEENNIFNKNKLIPYIK